MPRDPNTRTCCDCTQKVQTWEWCEVCSAYVCDGCNESHDCGDLELGSVRDTEDTAHPAEGQHSLDCDDPECPGDCASDEEDDSEE